MKIKVTEQMIREAVMNRGTRNKPVYMFCPVAMALRANGFPDATVGVSYFHLNDQNKRLPIDMLGKEAICLIRNFDAGRYEECRPIDFDIL